MGSEEVRGGTCETIHIAYSHGLVGGGTCGQCKPSCLRGLLHIFNIYIYIQNISHLACRSTAWLNAEGCCHLDVVLFMETIMSGVYLLV